MCWQPLNIPVPIDAIREEILAHEHHWRELAAAAHNLTNPLAQGIIDEEWREQDQWRGFSYTWNGVDRASGLGGVRWRNSSTDNWLWRGDCRAPRTREWVESLGFDVIHSVRALILEQGSAGVTHSDDPQRVYPGTGITVNCDSGGAALIYRDHQGVRHTVQETPLSIFDDSV
jgi:hypothetical protein